MSTTSSCKAALWGYVQGNHVPVMFMYVRLEVQDFFHFHGTDAHDLLEDAYEVVTR